MPSGKTHDRLTFVLAAPTFAFAWHFTGSFSLAAIAAAAFLFGGLMFGPDLDTQSIQYTRWGVFRFLWFPYKVVFAHRSRWSHGLVFGTFFRVVYFCGATTLFAVLISYPIAALRGGEPPALWQIQQLWQEIGSWTRANVGDHAIYAALAGVWLGAASHTLTDLAGTFLKTGKIKDFL